MSKIDFIKAEIAFYEKLFFASMAVILALIGWVAMQLLLAPVWLIGLSFIAVLCVVYYARDVYKKLRILMRDLKNA